MLIKPVLLIFDQYLKKIFFNSELLYEHKLR